MEDHGKVIDIIKFFANKDSAENELTSNRFIKSVKINEYTFIDLTHYVKR